MSEVQERYTTVAEGFGVRLAGIGPNQWSDPTPCTDWTVRDLVAHVVGTHRNVVATLGDEKAVEVDRDGDLARAWLQARASVEDALGDPARAQKTISGMFGEQTFESLVGRLLSSDTLLHTWDLARASDQDERLNPDAVVKSTEFLTPIDEAIRRPGGFAPKITPPDDADGQTRLLNFSGRAV
jgi:uncharacterized protein (TIGR03086 family)